MRGIDIYHGDSISETSTLKTVPEKAYKESDFVIVKATQGTSYKYTPFFFQMIERTIKDGKLAGAYHYAAGDDPVKEADYFISIVKPYIGEIVLALDWEDEQNPAFGSKTWCSEFINRVKEKTGVRCILYTGTDGCKQNNSLAGKVPLWFAGYPKPMASDWTIPKWKYDLGSWKICDIWQYTSTNEKCDRNTTNITPTEWKIWAASAAPAPDRHIELLQLYHEYIKKHSKNFINRYISSITSYHDAKAIVEAGKEIGITCVIPDKWAICDMGIRGYDGSPLISTITGTFGKYYDGDVRKYFDRIVKGGPVGLCVSEAVEKELLRKGDILCYENLTHISIYSGSGCMMYEGGGACVKDGHYPDGILKDYSKVYKARKISEVLRWRTKNSTVEKVDKKVDKSSEKAPAIKKTADILLTQARAWLGCKESDGSHKKIIDLYNSFKPLARGYKVKYTDSWCAAFVSACAIACNYTDIIPIECSCMQMIELAKKRGIWIENENRTPKPGEIILYDWQDSGKGDNKGTADHVGIVEKVSSGVITVIEGNYQDSVKRRTIAVNGKGIRGYISPKYDTLTSSQTSNPTQQMNKPVAVSAKKGYNGTFPALPPRGYYKRGDGISIYKNYPTQLKRVQKLINWITGAGLEVDGKFGAKTEAAVNKALEKFKQKKDGRFDNDLLKACKAYKK